MKKLLTIFAVFCFDFSAIAQTEIADGKSLIEAYISPLGNSLGAALNNGWYNTAKPHQLGGFDFTITANLVFVPADAETFNISESNGSSFSGGNTPTILGNRNGGNEATSITYGTITMPGGLDIPLLPVPMLQAGVGLIKNTEIDVRFMPEIKMKGVTTDLYGIGLKHDILQWIPVVDKIPIDLSIQAGYTKLNAKAELKNPSPTMTSNPNANLEITATTFNIILSKKLLMFTPYLGLGYNSIKASFSIDSPQYDIAGVTIPLEELSKFSSESSNKMKVNIGFRFNIAVLALQANYTISEYPVVTVGAGLSVR